MGKFLESEKSRLAISKQSTIFFSLNAKEDGLYKSKLRPYCLPRECSSENLYHGFREDAIKFFTEKEIKWHDAIDKKPSNHLCDSQVCCVNFLYYFTDKPTELKLLLSKVYPKIEEMLPIEDKKFLTFEYIGIKNYLREKQRGNQKRTRGANFTSADAAVKFRRTDGKIQTVLIEWKYSESYSSTNLKFSRSGTDRTQIYQHLYSNDNKLLNKSLLPSFDSLFFEPFYQLMRQQYLANEMECDNEYDSDFVSVLHISPMKNQDFKKITSKELSRLGDSALEVWANIQLQKDRFFSISTEDLFSEFIKAELSINNDWQNFIKSRYSTILEI